MLDRNPQAETNSLILGGDLTDSSVSAGRTVWLTGLPSAGKSTIANELAVRLRAKGARVEILDGDEIRRTLTADLGFDRAGRVENVRRIAFVASLLARNGVTVLVPVIAPYATSRKDARGLHKVQGIEFIELYVTAPVEVCASRDVKGLYALQRTGRLIGLTGVDDPYEPPTDPDLVVPTWGHAVDTSVSLVQAYLANRRPSDSD